MSRAALLKALACSGTGVPTSCFSLLSISGLFLKIVLTESSSTSKSRGIESTRRSRPNVTSKRSDDELKRVGGLAIEPPVAQILNDGRARLAQEGHRGSVGRLVGDDLFRQSRGRRDGGEERLVAVAQTRCLARATLHREQRSRQLLRLRRDARQ
jgi:hypothetical protein